jgi:CRISPR-associated protein Cst2
LDLRSAGTFYHREKAGYKNLDTHRKQQAQERSLEPFDNDRAYRLPRYERMERIQTLLRGMALIDGGAKQALHYTNVVPSFVVCAVMKGGNNPFGHIVNPNSRGEPRVNVEALSEALEVFSDQFLSPLYVGWVRGFMDDQREGVENSLTERDYVLGHPRRVFERIAEDFASAENAGWLD